MYSSTGDTLSVPAIGRSSHGIASSAKYHASREVKCFWRSTERAVVTARLQNTEHPSIKMYVHPIASYYEIGRWDDKLPRTMPENTSRKRRIRARSPHYDHKARSKVVSIEGEIIMRIPFIMFFIQYVMLYMMKPPREREPRPDWWHKQP